MLMAPPLNTSYADSSHELPQTSPDRQETSRPIGRPEWTVASLPSVGVRGWLGLRGRPEPRTAVGPSDLLGNSVGLRVRSSKHSWPRPSGLMTSTRQMSPHSTGGPGLWTLVSSPLGLYQDSGKAAERRPLTCIFIVALSSLERAVILCVI